MNSSPSTPGTPSQPPGAGVTVHVPRLDIAELRDLLEANLAALQALQDEHRRMVHRALGQLASADHELRRELAAVASPRAPWVAALEQTRALLFVALRELIVGDNEAELSMQLPRVRG